MPKKEWKENTPNGPVRLGAILRNLIEKTTGQRLPVQNCKIWEIWDGVVGTKIAKNARPQTFQDGRLYVGTLHPTWIIELNFRREEIKEKLNRELGRDSVKEIIFRLSSKI